MSDQYEFTNQWFDFVKPHWPGIIAKLPKCKRVLEIGSYEGASACWLIENAIEDDGNIVCVDTWEGGEEHSDIDMDQVKARFERNVALSTLKRDQKVACLGWQGFSADYLAGHPTRFPYDFIYIDGSHQAPDVLTDAVMAWRLLEIGGIMLFDDYEWQGHPQPTHRPKMAINAFLSVFAEGLEVVHKDYQLAIRRKK